MRRARKLSMRQGWALACALIGGAATAHAGGPTLTITRPPCTIEITPVDPFFHGDNPAHDGQRETAQTRADAEKIKQALEEALRLSADMRVKTDAACANHGGKIRVLVYRDTTVFTGAQADHGSGTIRIDLGVMERVRDDLKSPSEPAKDTVAAAALTRSLAHEMDHLRQVDRDDKKTGKKKEDHSDPHGEEASETTGPAVDDENLVIREMGGTFNERRFYVSTAGGNPYTVYWVDTDGDGQGDERVRWFPYKPARVTREQGGSSHYIQPPPRTPSRTFRPAGPPAGVPAAPADAAVPASLDGFYVGTRVRVVTGDSSISERLADGFTTFQTRPRDSSFAFTGEFGYVASFQQRWFAGAAVALTVTDFRAVHDFGSGASLLSRINGYGTVTGQVGAWVTPQLALFVEGGAAFAHQEVAATFAPMFSESEITPGSVAGGGLKVRIQRAVNVTLRYQHVVFRRTDPVTSGGFNYSAQTRFNTIAVGLEVPLN
jgi:hypothetical protein